MPRNNRNKNPQDLGMPIFQSDLGLVNEVLEETCMKPIFKQEIMLGLYEENSTSSTNLIILYKKWYLDQAKREVTAPFLPSYAAALRNALSAQYDFMEKKCLTTTK